MSTLGYSDRLSPYEAKGKCGAPEIFDSVRVVQNKINKLIELFRLSKHVVLHTGAGISTSAKLPDFRGSKGVWTLEKQGKALPSGFVDFEHAVPSPTHMAIVALYRAGYVKYIVTQNVDGLHLKSGLPREALAELHGNVFTEVCRGCGKEYVRDFDVKGCGLKPTGRHCSVCGAPLRDFLLDWEDELPAEDLAQAEAQSSQADLCVCLGTSLQIVPSADIPFLCKKNKGKGGQVVICNLQKTPRDGKADVIIHTYVDEVMRGLMQGLGLAFPLYRAVCRFHVVLDHGDTLAAWKNGHRNNGSLFQTTLPDTTAAPSEQTRPAPGINPPLDPMSVDSFQAPRSAAQAAGAPSICLTDEQCASPASVVDPGTDTGGSLLSPARAATSAHFAHQARGLGGLSVPVDRLARRGSFCVEALGPGEEAPDDPPPMVVPGQVDEVLLPVPPRPSAAQPVDDGHPRTRIAVQSPAGGSLVCIQRVEARQDPHAAWEPMTAVGHPPARYEAWVVGNVPAAGEVRVWFDMPERDVDSIDIAWHMDPGAAPQAAGEELAPPGTRQLSVPLAMGTPQLVAAVTRVVDYNEAGAGRDHDAGQPVSKRSRTDIQ